VINYKHYVDVNGEVWGYPDDGTQDDLIPATHARIPDADFDTIRKDAAKLYADKIKNVSQAVTEKVSLLARIVNYVRGK
jgi:hypothetical protein